MPGAGCRVQGMQGISLPQSRCWGGGAGTHPLAAALAWAHASQSTSPLRPRTCPWDHPPPCCMGDYIRRSVEKRVTSTRSTYLRMRNCTFLGVALMRSCAWARVSCVASSSFICSIISPSRTPDLSAMPLGVTCSQKRESNYHFLYSKYTRYDPNDLSRSTFA